MNLANFDLPAHLFDENSEPLVFEWFGELDVLSTLVVDGEGSDDHVSQASQQLPHHPVPLLLIAVVDLRVILGRRGGSDKKFTLREQISSSILLREHEKVVRTSKYLDLLLIIQLWGQG